MTDYERFFRMSISLFCIVGKDGYFKMLNPAWAKYLGYSIEELLARPYIDFVHPDDRAATREACAEMLRAGEISGFENRYLAKSGEYKWLRWNAFLDTENQCFYGVANDVNEKKIAEAQLRLLQREMRARDVRARVEAEAARARLYKLFEQFPAIAAVLRGPEHAFELANEACRALLGRNEIVGTPITDAIPSLSPEFVNVLDRVYASGERFVSQSCSIKADWSASGVVEERAFSIVCEPTHGASGLVDGIWMIASDLTETRRLETRLRITERMASMGTLAAGVAHEINNPLAFSTANLSLALEDLRDTPACQLEPRRDGLLASMDAALQGLERMRSIVKSLKVFSRNDEDKVEAVDVRETLSQAVDLTLNEIRHRATLFEEFGEVPMVKANKGRLCQVFVNLLMNAAHAIGEGAAGGNQIRVRTRRGRDSEAVIEIEDSGCGIPPEVLSRIFDPFFTTKPQGEGTGLGLSICHGIISSLGGQINIRSEVGRGTRVHVVLPAMQYAEVQPQAPARVSSANSQRHLDVLVIDDEEELGNVIGRLLRKDKHRPTVISQAPLGLELLQSGARFDIILCDLMMPELTGMDLYEELKRSHPGLESRIVFMTGGAFTERSKAWLEKISNPLLEKPFDANMLRKMLEGAL